MWTRRPADLRSREAISRVESAAMNAAFMSFFPALVFIVPALLWYIAVIVLLFKIWQELKAIRLSR